MATALLVLAGIIIVVGAWVLFSTIKTNKAAVEHINQVSTNNSSTTATSSDVPDERPVTSHGYSNYVVAADLPRYLRIPKYNVKARVVRLGVLSDGALATPRSIWDVGWYDGSSKPGEAGAALMAGHYSGPTQPGAFAKIDGLVVGDMMAVEMGDGRIYNYEVVKTETVPDDQVSMAKTLVSVTPGKNGLNLITCAGEYSPKTANYSERTIVYAVQI